MNSTPSVLPCRTSSTAMRQAHQGWAGWSLCVLLLLTACDKVGPIVDTSGPTKTVAMIQVVWSTPQEIEAICGRDQFERPNQACILNDYRIVMQKPAGFNDETRVCSLGHETLHALGATHK